MEKKHHNRITFQLPPSVAGYILKYHSRLSILNNGIARRAWARNKEAIIAIERAMEQEPKLKITVPNLVDDRLLDEI